MGSYGGGRGSGFAGLGGEIDQMKQMDGEAENLDSAGAVAGAEPGFHDGRWEIWRATRRRDWQLDFVR